MFRTGPAESKDPSGEKIGIKWAFQQVNDRQEANQKLEEMRLEMAQLQEQVNAPLKRKPDVSEDLPPAKKPRLVDVLPGEAVEPEVGEPKPNPKPKPQPKTQPKPKLKQPKLSHFFKKF